MKTQALKSATRRALIAAAFSAAALPSFAANRNWSGATGTAAVPADISDTGNWDGSGALTSDTLLLNVSALTYLTNSMANAATDCLCDNWYMREGDFSLTGSFKVNTHARIGDVANKTANVVFNGGSISVGNTLYLAYNTATDTGKLTVNGGTLSAGTLVVSRNGKGEVYVNGGEVSVANRVNFGSQQLQANAAVYLNGGVLSAKEFYCHRRKSGSATVVFDGGTFKASSDGDIVTRNSSYASEWPNFAPFEVGAKGGTIDTAGHDIATVVKFTRTSGTNGGMRFIGGGTVAITNAIEYTGNTSVATGTTIVVPKANATTLLSNGVALAGAPELNTPYTVLSSSDAEDDWSDLDLSNVTCPVASALEAGVGADGKSIVVTVTALKSGNVWTGAKDSNMSDPGNWLGGVVPADGSDIDLSTATTVNADLDCTFGTVTMGAGVVTFTGDKMRATSFSDTSKVAVGANSTVTIDGDLEFSSGGNSYACNYVGDGGAFVVTGDIIATSTFSSYLDPCMETVGTGVVAAKGLVNNAVDNRFRLVRAIAGYHANWLIGEHGLSGSKTFAISGNVNATAKIIAAADFMISNTVAAHKRLELDAAGHTVAIAADYKGSGERIFSGSGTVEVASGIDLGTGAITLGAGTTFALIASSNTFTPLANAITLPSTGVATLRIDGTRLASGKYTIATGVGSGAEDHLAVTGAALAGRRTTLAVEDGSLVLEVKSAGLTVIIR